MISKIFRLFLKSNVRFESKIKGPGAGNHQDFQNNDWYY